MDPSSISIKVKSENRQHAERENLLGNVFLEE
jgi:hypothetical protein